MLNAEIFECRDRSSVYWWKIQCTQIARAPQVSQPNCRRVARWARKRQLRWLHEEKSGPNGKQLSLNANFGRLFVVRYVTARVSHNTTPANLLDLHDSPESHSHSKMSISFVAHNCQVATHHQIHIYILQNTNTNTIAAIRQQLFESNVTLFIAALYCRRRDYEFKCRTTCTMKRAAVVEKIEPFYVWEVEIIFCGPFASTVRCKLNADEECGCQTCRFRSKAFGTRWAFRFHWKRTRHWKIFSFA